MILNDGLSIELKLAYLDHELLDMKQGLVRVILQY